MMTTKPPPSTASGSRFVDPGEVVLRHLQRAGEVAGHDAIVDVLGELGEKVAVVMAHFVAAHVQTRRALAPLPRSAPTSS